MLDHDVHGIVLKSHLKQNCLVLQIVELGSADLGSCLEVDQIQFLAQLDMVQGLETEYRGLAHILDGRVVLVFLSDRCLGMGVVGNLADNGHECLVYFLKFGFDCCDAVLYVAAFSDEDSAGFIVHLALHPGCIGVPCRPEFLGRLHKIGSSVLKCDGLVHIDFHVAVCNVLCNLITPCAEFSVINHDFTSVFIK